MRQSRVTFFKTWVTSFFCTWTSFHRIFSSLSIIYWYIYIFLKITSTSKGYYIFWFLGIREFFNIKWNFYSCKKYLASVHVSGIHIILSVFYRYITSKTIDEELNNFLMESHCTCIVKHLKFKRAIQIRRCECWFCFWDNGHLLPIVCSADSEILMGHFGLSSPKSPTLDLRIFTFVAEQIIILNSLRCWCWLPSQT